MPFLAVHSKLDYPCALRVTSRLVCVKRTCFFFSIGSTQKVSLVRATAKASLVATLSESLPLSSSVNGQKLIISVHIGMKKARSDNYQCCHDNISAVTISVLSRS